MKQGWEIKSLMELASVNTGKWDANHATENGAYRFYTCAYAYLFCDTKRFEGECLILPGNGVNVGEVFYYNGEFDAYQRTYVISEIKILPKYLHYHMLLHWKELGTKQQYGSATNFIKIGNFKEYKVQYPSLPEQHHIVSILDKTFSAIDKAKTNAEQNLKNAKEVFESCLQGVFEKKGSGWEEKKLGEVFCIGSSKRIMEKDWTTSGVPFYGGKEIVKLSKFNSVTSNAYISEEKYNEYALKYDMPQQGDILITARGTIGIGYIVQKGDKFYYKDGNIISMRAKTPTNPQFILYALKSNTIYAQLKKLTGATVAHLPIEKAKELILMIPNFSTQNIVVEKIEEIEAETQKLEAVYQQKVADLEELKKSILQKAFSGELKTEKML